MTLVELRYLVAIATEKHFGRAARACHVSQPALSAGLKNLEEELGRPLVERGPAGVRLTGVGEEVVAQARRVLDEVARVETVARIREPLSGRLRLGAISTLAPFALAPLFVPLLHAHPELDLYLREGLTQDLVALLRRGELDAIMMALPIDEPGLAWEPLFDEPFLALLPADSPLAKRRRHPLQAEDLVDARLILLTEGHCFRDQALAVCRGRTARDEPGRDQLAATSLHTIWRMVEAGLGCTLLPRLAADEVRAGTSRVKVLSFGDPPPSRRIGLVWRARAPVMGDVRALSAFVRGHLPKGLTAVAQAGD